MRILQWAGILLGLAGAIAAPTIAAGFTPISQQMQTAHYRLDLQIGPMEKMFIPADVAAQHLTAGEVMVGGTMLMPKDTTTAAHLEIHVYSIDKGTLISDADVTIAVSDAAKNVQRVPAAKMYGIAEGPSDTHYGNNVDLPPSNYTIDVTVNGEKAEFLVAIPSA